MYVRKYVKTVLFSYLRNALFSNADSLSGRKDISLLL
jgi:hypothetical protein